VKYLLFILLLCSAEAQTLRTTRITALDMTGDSLTAQYIRAGNYAYRLVMVIDSGWTYEDSLRLTVNGKLLYASKRADRDSASQIIYDIALKEAGEQNYELKSGVAGEESHPPTGAVIIHIFTLSVTNTRRYESDETIHQE